MVTKDTAIEATIVALGASLWVLSVSLTDRENIQYTVLLIVSILVSHTITKRRRQMITRL